MRTPARHCQTVRRHQPAHRQPAARADPATIRTAKVWGRVRIRRSARFSHLRLLATIFFSCAVAIAGSSQASELGEFDPYARTAGHGQTAQVSMLDPLSAIDQRWCLDFLPDGLIYRPYLAGPKESRSGIQFIRADNESIVDSSIGGQWGLFRIGTEDVCFPQGLQLDVEASAQLRHRSLASFDLLSTDFRFGLPLSYSRSNHQTKLGLYFLHSNPSDRLLERIGRLRSQEFFQRKSIVLGHSIYLTNRFRVYGEAGYAFSSKVSDKWELQFGTEYAPVCPTGLLGSPFLAANGYLREELDFGGTFTLQAGWAWRKKRGRLFRIGLQYANGASHQFSLHDEHEQQFGFGIWYDP